MAKTRVSSRIAIARGEPLSPSLTLLFGVGSVIVFLFLSKIMPKPNLTFAGSAPGLIHACGLPMTKNPHDDAGEAGVYLTVGCIYECIPCLVKSRHEWSRRAQAAESEIHQFFKRSKKALKRALDEFDTQVAKLSGSAALPDGFVLLQTNPSCAADLSGGKWHGWLFIQEDDLEWSRKRRLLGWEIMQAEDQRDDGIVIQGGA
jgi:hypothetical protein